MDVLQKAFRQYESAMGSAAATGDRLCQMEAMDGVARCFEALRLQHKICNCRPLEFNTRLLEVAGSVGAKVQRILDSLPSPPPSPPPSPTFSSVSNFKSLLFSSSVRFTAHSALSGGRAGRGKATFNIVGIYYVEKKHSRALTLFAALSEDRQIETIADLRFLGGRRTKRTSRETRRRHGRRFRITVRWLQRTVRLGSRFPRGITLFSHITRQVRSFVM